jgi:membrane peptidoglycan carboxypeptidase
VPLLAGLEVSGAFAFSGDLTFDTRRPKDTRVTWEVGNGCKITRVPANISPERFARPWVRTVLGPTGSPTPLESGPGTAGWVPLFEISPYVATAVVVCEDANFWTHGGFNQKSIQDSIRDDLRTGRFVRGGSTVTMQLAKNLYLKREKTLSRKLQEAVLTVLLEQTLTKEQILELYLNIIEFAPGLYGIGPAAAHYFHSTPRALSLGQALYLITLLPNPKITHFKADGSLSDGWTEYLRHLMEIAHKIRRIDDKELATGLAEEIQRGVAANDDEAASGASSEDSPPDRDDDGP